MAAISTILELLETGSHVIVSDVLYGGSYRLFEGVKRPSEGMKFNLVDMANTAATPFAQRHPAVEAIHYPGLPSGR